MFGRSTSWSLFGMVLALVLVASSLTAQETEEQKCSDFTPDNRPCTAMEELDYCLRNSVKAFEECKEGRTALGKVACAATYYVDFYACGFELPFTIIMK
jgi:hypothetical protein